MPATRIEWGQRYEYSAGMNTLRRRDSMAFTLVEIMVVVFIIGLVSVMAYPAWLKVRRASLVTAFVSDLRVGSMAFQQYPFANNGTWPPDAAPATVPEGMEVDLGRMKWSDSTSLGGQWDWDHDARTVEVVSATAPDEWFADVDLKIDDGDLNGGSFRKKADGTGYSYMVDN